jgi:hypothetical protein
MAVVKRLRGSNSPIAVIFLEDAQRCRKLVRSAPSKPAVVLCWKGIDAEDKADPGNGDVIVAPYPSDQQSAISILEKIIDR